MLQIDHISKVYDTGIVKTIALDDVSFKVETGEFVAIMGPSGSGKSTLMHILGALDLPSKGKYIIDQEDISNLLDDELASVRNRKIGFIFQAFNLLPRVSALVNVMLPMAYAGVPKLERVEKAKKLLKMVGLEDRMYHASNQLSGGQQQRVAIARALAMDPAILLADEPTGNIASAQAEEIMNIFHKLHETGRTIVMITHEPEIAANASRIITIRDGKIASDKNVTKKSSN